MDEKIFNRLVSALENTSTDTKQMLYMLLEQKKEYCFYSSILAFLFICLFSYIVVKLHKENEYKEYRYFAIISLAVSVSYFVTNLLNYLTPLGSILQ